MSHPVRGRLAEFDDLPRDERQQLLEHARDCAACRRALIAADPARLFALLGVDALPDEALERLSDRVGREVDRSARPAVSRRRVYGAASIAASLVLGAVLGAYLLTPRHEQEDDGGIVAVEGETTPAEQWIPSEGQPAAQPVRGVELISSPSSGRVVNLLVGGTRVVMIFDEELDI